MTGQALSLVCRTLSDLWKRLGGPHAFSLPQDRFQKWFSGLRVPPHGDRISLHPAVIAILTEYLFPTRPCRLSFRAFAFGLTVVLDQLVETLETGCIFGSVQPSTYAKAVDRRTALNEIAQTVFIEISAAEDSNVLQSGAVQNLTDVSRMHGEISAIQADRLDLDAALTQARRQICNHVRSLFGVIRVD